MNEFNDNGLGNLMDIPVEPNPDEIEETVQSTQEVLMTETQEVLPNETNNSVDMVAVNQGYETDSNTIGTLNNGENLTSKDYSAELNAEPEMTIIPDTMEANYGVIPPNNSETVLNSAPKYNSSKTILGVIIGILVVILATVGFLAYKVYFSVDPVKTFTTKIREYGKSADEMYNNSATKAIYQKNDKIKNEASFNVDIEMNGEKVALDLGYDLTMLKSDNKTTANIKANYANNNIMNMNATIFKNALFIKVLEDGHNFRLDSDTTEFFKDLEESINNPKDITTFETYANYLAKSIENNISKKDFKIGVSKTKINNKDVLASKYSLVLDKKMVDNIINDLINSFKNDETLGEIFANYEKPQNLSNIESNSNIILNVYVNLKGVVKVEIASEGDKSSISYNKINDEKYFFIINDGKNDLMTADINKTADKTQINAVINVDPKTKIIADYEMTKTGDLNISIKIDGVELKLSGQIINTEEKKKITNKTNLIFTAIIPEMSTNIKATINANSIVEANENLSVPMPNGAINIETPEGQALLESEMGQTGLLQLIESLFNSYVYPQVEQNIINNTNQNLLQNNNI